MEPAVDTAFIRSAVELADLNAVRVALYQATKDPELAALPTAINLSAAQRELLIDKAVVWLEKNSSTEMATEPPQDELVFLHNVVRVHRHSVRSVSVVFGSSSGDPDGVASSHGPW